MRTLRQREVDTSARKDLSQSWLIANHSPCWAQDGAAFSPWFCSLSHMEVIPRRRRQWDLVHPPLEANSGLQEEQEPSWHQSHWQIMQSWAGLAWQEAGMLPLQK